MRMRGLEPPRACAHTALNRARLPIPPHPRGHSVARLLATPRRLFGLRRGLLVPSVPRPPLPPPRAPRPPPPRPRPGAGPRAPRGPPGGEVDLAPHRGEQPLAARPGRANRLALEREQAA